MNWGLEMNIDKIKQYSLFPFHLKGTDKTSDEG